MSKIKSKKGRKLVERAIRKVLEDFPEFVGLCQYKKIYGLRDKFCLYYAIPNGPIFINLGIMIKMWKKYKDLDYLCAEIYQMLTLAKNDGFMEFRNKHDDLRGEYVAAAIDFYCLSKNPYKLSRISSVFDRFKMRSGEDIPKGKTLEEYLDMELAGDIAMKFKIIPIKRLDKMI